MKLKAILSLVVFLFLTSCAGTGTKTIPTVSAGKGGETNLYFVRSSGFIASGVLAKIEVNGAEIAKLGVSEYVDYETSNNFRIKVSGSGIGGLGIGVDSTSGIADGKNYFYIIGVKQGLFSTKFTIQETTENNFKQID